MLSSTQEFEWDDECVQAYQALKTRLTIVQAEREASYCSDQDSGDADGGGPVGRDPGCSSHMANIKQTQPTNRMGAPSKQVGSNFPVVSGSQNPLMGPGGTGLSQSVRSSISEAITSALSISVPEVVRNAVRQELSQVSVRGIPEVRPRGHIPAGGPTVRRRPRYSMSSSSSEGESPNRISFESGTDGGIRNVSRRSFDSRQVKLPAFTGKETWNVFFNRFSEVATRYGWDEGERLDQLLPRLQGSAGEFVYSQLSTDVRKNYKVLVRELNNRFRVIENPKAFSQRFSHRNQKMDESVEDYAAELNRLYDKAHARRDQATRREDLLRRFLDGLANDKARFHVEYVKEPADIDEAVYEVVNYLQTRISEKKFKTQRRAVHFSDSDSDLDDRVNRTQAKGQQGLDGKIEAGRKGEVPVVTQETRVEGLETQVAELRKQQTQIAELISQQNQIAEWMKDRPVGVAAELNRGVEMLTVGRIGNVIIATE